MKLLSRVPDLQPLAPEDLAAAVDRLVLTRWVASVLVVVLTLVCVHGLAVPLPRDPLLGLGAALALYNAGLARYASWVRKRQAGNPERALALLRAIVLVHVALDWVAMFAFLHLTGGVTSPATPLFLIHLLMVTVLLPARSPYLYVGLAVAALAALASLEAAGHLQHYAVLPLPQGLHRDLRFIAAQLSFFAIVAFASVHLTGLVVRRRRERDRQVAELQRAAQAVSSSLKLDEVLDRLVGNAANAFGAKAGAIRLIDETGQRMAMIASCGLSERYLNKGFVEMSRSQIDREALSGTPVIVVDALADPRIQYPREVTDEGIRSMLVVPVVGRHGPLGVLRVYDGRPHRFGVEDVEFALSVASQGAAAIENALTHGSLQRLEQARSQFVRTVTHELRSPLSGARSMLKVLLEGLVGEVPAEQRTMLVRVDARLTFLSELVNDLLALAATQSAELQEKPVAMDLVTALRRVVEHQTLEGTAKGLTVTLDAPEAPIMVLATDQGLARIFGNLIGNAIKYTPSGGRVEVRVAAQGSGVVVSVADTGIGIPEDELPNLWQDFFRARNARLSEVVGTGLGLSIVKRIVTGYGGLISIQSKLAEGTTISVALPGCEERPGGPREPETVAE
ncbi:MAG: GAF domain-containing protein [Deltaproteobacteria bacterium]|nr:GAF domain-containing protein [Deltaproteobacteria bacterium]